VSGRYSGYMIAISPSAPHLRTRSLAKASGRALLLVAFSAGALALPVPGALAAAAPAATTSGSSDVTYSSASVYGSVNPNGLATDYRFQYGTTTAYGGQTSLAPAGNGTTAVRFGQELTGLRPGTVYHYRLVAVNSDGTTEGHDHTFKTASVPLSVQIAGVPDPVVFGNPFYVEGNLVGTGADDHEIVLQVNPFPYETGFKDVGNPEITNAAGGFSFPYLGLLENAQLRVVTVGKPEVASPVIVENVAVRVTFHVHSTRRRGYARLYGTVTPAEVGALVGFQLLTPGRSTNEGGTAVKSDTATVSSFGRVVHVRHPGLYEAVVQVADGSHVSAYSSPVLVR